MSMANLNKVMLIGRLTRDPEARMFTNGGKVANFGFAVNNRRKNNQTGQWEDEPVFVDCKAFNRGENGTLADRVEQTLKKGQQIFIEGHLTFEQWDDKNTGQKRSTLRVIVDNFQYLERREDGGGGGGYQRPMSSPRRPAAGGDDFEQGSPEPEPEMPAAGRSPEEDIPF
jgi:single-strand DNA-binding protein